MGFICKVEEFGYFILVFEQENRKQNWVLGRLIWQWCLEWVKGKSERLKYSNNVGNKKVEFGVGKEDEFK